ncbi:hypothetical protein [Caldovatus aquaticus]|nr:hypothetical protein [Caldovatus aquaticus]
MLLAGAGCRVLGVERRAAGESLLVHDCAGARGRAVPAGTIGPVPDGPR